MTTDTTQLIAVDHTGQGRSTTPAAGVDRTGGAVRLLELPDPLRATSRRGPARRAGMRSGELGRDRPDRRRG